ncbi:MAG: alpha/beta hydrolase [Gemmatimonadetes bacterium]|nr:alpha/beta hydrolase [Gemmatimonadota bacterium]
MRFLATASRGEVGALLLTPTAPSALLVLAHGAGAGMEHTFMERLARALAERGVATFRYQFPYAAAGGRRPDPPAVLEATVRAAVAAGAAAAPGLPVFAGGKSMGGRMTSRAAAAGSVIDAAGIVFFGFPLHGAGGPRSVKRAAHLAEVSQPMLFLQGTRDALADLGLMTGVCEALPRATLHVVDGGDHGFHVLKRSGRDDGAVIAELADVCAAWMERHAGAHPSG